MKFKSNLLFLVFGSFLLSSCDLWNSFKGSGADDVSFPAHNLTCNWDTTGLKVFQCSNGKIYNYGSSTCESISDSEIFCESSLSASPLECKQDQSLETQKCLKEKQQQTIILLPGTHQPPPSEACVWHPNPPNIVECNGVSYVHGALFCVITYPKVFCRKSLANNFLACRKDHSVDTFSCMGEHDFSIDGYNLD